MRKMLVDTLQGEAVCGAVLRYHYYILVDQLEAGGVCCGESYGVKIAAADDDSDGVELRNITSSLSRIDALMDLLTRNFVTPVSLADVVADWL